MYNSFILWLQHHMLLCPFKWMFHVDCPGCGMQRSFLRLLQGDLTGSLQYHPATMPMLGLFIFLPLHLIFRFRNGGKVLVILQIIVAVISISFYVYKIVDHHK